MLISNCNASPSSTENCTSTLQSCSTDNASLILARRCADMYLRNVFRNASSLHGCLQLCSNTQILQLCEDVHNAQPPAFFFKACCSPTFQYVLQVGARLLPAARLSFRIRDLQRLDSYSSGDATVFGLCCTKVTTCQQGRSHQQFTNNVCCTDEYLYTVSLYVERASWHSRSTRLQISPHYSVRTVTSPRHSSVATRHCGAFSDLDSARKRGRAGGSLLEPAAAKRLQCSGHSRLGVEKAC